MTRAALALGGLAVMGVAAGAQQTPAPAKPPTFPTVNSQVGSAYALDQLENTLTHTLA